MRMHPPYPGAARGFFWFKDGQSLALSLQWKELKVDVPPRYLLFCYQFLTFLWMSCCFYETGESPCYGRARRGVK